MDAIVDVTFSYTHSRAKLARVRQVLDGFWRQTLVLLALFLVVGGGALVFVEFAIGWFVIGLAALPAMIILWWNGALKDLEATKHPKELSDVLDPEILGRLSRQPNIQELATILGSTNGGLFFGARFGLTPSLLQNIASEEGIELDSVWRRAEQLRSELVSAKMTPGMVLVALVRQFHNHEALLAQLHIDDSDLAEGLQWQQRLQTLIANQKKAKRSGGIGRDLSFGYTPLLSRFGRNISNEVSGGSLTIETSSHQRSLSELLTLFGGNGQHNAVITGPTGAGKTTLVYAFAEMLLDAASHIPSSLKFRQVVMLDASALISAAPGRGQLENLLNQVLGEAYAAKNIIIFLDNAQLFFEDGVGSVNVGNLLLPILEAGRLPIMLAMDEQRYLQIAQRTPGITTALNRVALAATDRGETLEVLQHQLILNEFRHKVTYSYQSLAEAYRLSERYVHDIAMPGQALKLLDSAARFAEGGLVTINSVQQAIEQTIGVKVSVASDVGDREALLNLESLMHERMINQTRAVSVVSDALRRARAGVRNENRPIGTFLFLGPTGVGKTELAKALADVYFNGEENIIRLDLNEYVRNEDVSRLIADGATDSSSLTAQAMKRPFSVILLDEIEKAHPNVLTTLLQLLDEGILRDINNREVSFRDAIVIATSNAGADRIREYIERGYKLEQFEQQFTDELISSGQFKPEFLNRFDEIVTFTPLSKPDLLKVVDLMIAGVNKTLANQKVSVHVSDEAKLLLVERGYDPRLGARPMRRVVQRTVENTVAKQMLSGNVQPGSEIEITEAQVEQLLGSQASADAIVAESKTLPQQSDSVDDKQ